jgi:phage terminase small subunit
MSDDDSSITDEHLDAVEKLILTREGGLIWRRLAFGWAKLGWLRKDTLLRFTVMCSTAGAYWDALRTARKLKEPVARRRFLEIAEEARVAARKTAVELGVLPTRRARVAPINARGEDEDLLRVLPPSWRRRPTVRKRSRPAVSGSAGAPGRR